MTSVDESRTLGLDEFRRTVDVSDRTTGSPFLTQDVPRFQGCPEFDLHTALDEFPDVREPELEVRCEPPDLQRITVPLHVLDHIGKVIPDEVGQQEPVME